jgi:endonuclease-3
MTDRSLGQVIEKLRADYGDPESPPITDPFELVLYENVSYLVSDEHRWKAFENLRRSVGLRPADILSASAEQFKSVVELAGSDKKGRVKKLIDSAQVAMKHFDGDVRPVLDLPFKKAVAAMMWFPSIGEPGAEKILLFCGMAEVLPLESNGLRVLVRLGYAEESANYTATYRNVRAAISGVIVKDREWLIDAYLLMRQHGQQICKRTKPLCGQCVLLDGCKFGQEYSA